ncbi:sensor histidine kinase [Mucilaginibacter terrigena]|uniref:sensor histidine kinase n=1 Tax=Mucilaginibacter terrigena TaxID=2492395 RepID=UPI00193A27D7|nr:sensor histidine kinase [Mucilaginibacter terrigena]
MNRIKKLFVLIHVVLWTIFSLLVVLQLRTDGNQHWLIATLGFILTGLYAFYSHFFLLTRYLGKNQPGAYFIRFTGIVLSGPVIFIIFQYIRQDTRDDLFESYLMSLISIVLIFVLLGWLARITENLVLNTIRKEQLEKQAVESELYYLKSQINPHFLFNTLNNIHTLVYKQAPAAPEAVMRLASLMRYMIYESNASMVPLTREIDYLQDYMGLQQLRYKKALVADLEIKGNAASCNIAPLLFIHLLENAYKHSPARLEPGDIKVGIGIIGNSLTFHIKNPMNEKHVNTLEGPGGIGLQNVRKRLALLYPGAHTLEINTTDGMFNLTLKISALHSPAS